MNPFCLKNQKIIFQHQKQIPCKLSLYSVPDTKIASQKEPTEYNHPKPSVKPFSFDRFFLPCKPYHRAVKKPRSEENADKETPAGKFPDFEKNFSEQISRIIILNFHKR